MRSLFEENNGLSEQSLTDEAIQNILSYWVNIKPETVDIVWATVLN